MEVLAGTLSYQRQDANSFIHYFDVLSVVCQNFSHISRHRDKDKDEINHLPPSRGRNKLHKQSTECFSTAHLES